MTLSMNAVFGRLMMFVYLKIITVTYRALVIVLSGDFSRSAEVARVLTPFIEIAVLYDMSSIGSDIIVACTSTVADIRRRYWHQRMKTLFPEEFGVEGGPKAGTEVFSSGLSHEVVQALTNHLGYDENQDALLISDCFPHRKPTFHSYIGAIVTCIVILLQFDYRIMAKFDADKMSVSTRPRPQEKFIT